MGHSLLPAWFWCVKSLWIPTVTMGMEREQLATCYRDNPACSSGQRAQQAPCPQAHPLFVARASGHRVADLSGAGQGLTAGLAQAPVPERAPPAERVRVSLGMALERCVATASEGHLAPVCSGSQFNEP